jgi:hypothetical protein
MGEEMVGDPRASKSQKRNLACLEVILVLILVYVLARMSWGAEIIAYGRGTGSGTTDVPAVV